MTTATAPIIDTQPSNCFRYFYNFILLPKTNEIVERKLLVKHERIPLVFQYARQ
jgi:hypothetical protein